VGDHVIIEFEDQDWSKPRVIGFYDSPKQCPLWVKITFGTFAANPVFRSWVNRQQAELTDYITLLDQLYALYVDYAEMLQNRVGKEMPEGQLFFLTRNWGDE